MTVEAEYIIANLPRMRWKILKTYIGAIPKAAVDPHTAHTNDLKKTSPNLHSPPLNIIKFKGGNVELARQDHVLRVKMIVFRCTDA